MVTALEAIVAAWVDRVQDRPHPVMAEAFLTFAEYAEGGVEDRPDLIAEELDWLGRLLRDAADIMRESQA